LWDTSNWEQICELRDEKEENIEEFYHMQWSDNSKHLIVSGKMKSRSKWSEEDEDNCILILNSSLIANKLHTKIFFLAH
jgi:hypothetical protein